MLVAEDQDPAYLSLNKEGEDHDRAQERIGLAQKPRRAIAFYVTIAISTAIGLLLNVTSIDPIKALFWSAVINGVVAVPIMVMLMFMAANRRVMGRYVIKRGLQAVGWTATIVMAIVAVGMFATWNAQ